MLLLLPLLCFTTISCMEQTLPAIKKTIDQEYYRDLWIHLENMKNDSSVEIGTVNDLLHYAQDTYRPRNIAAFRKQTWITLFLAGLSGSCYGASTANNQVMNYDKEDLQTASVALSAVTLASSLSFAIYSTMNSRAKIISKLKEVKKHKEQQHIAHV